MYCFTHRYCWSSMTSLLALMKNVSITCCAGGERHSLCNHSDPTFSPDCVTVCFRASYLHALIYNFVIFEILITKVWMSHVLRAPVVLIRWCYWWEVSNYLESWALEGGGSIWPGLNSIWGVCLLTLCPKSFLLQLPDSSVPAFPILVDCFLWCLCQDEHFISLKLLMLNILSQQ